MKDKCIREIPYSATKNFFWQSAGKSPQIRKKKAILNYNSVITPNGRLKFLMSVFKTKIQNKIFLQKLNF
jgi:hypothetical protein